MLLAIAVGPSLGFWPGKGQPPGLVPFLFLALAALALAAPVLLLAPGLERRIGDIAAGKRRHRPAFPPSLCALASLAWLAAAAMLVGDLDLRWQWLPVLQAILIAIWTFASVVDNLGPLQGVRLGRWLLAGAALCALTVAFGDFALATGGIRNHGTAVGVNSSLAVLGVALTLNLLLPVATSTALALADQRVAVDLARRPEDRKTYGLPAMLCQDQGLMRLLVIFAVWLPMLALAHVPDGTAERWFGIASLVAGFHLLLGRPFFWVLQNNLDHLDRQRRQRQVPDPAPPAKKNLERLPGAVLGLSRQVRNPGRLNDPDRDYIEALEGHIRLQNAVGLGMIWLTVIGVLVYLNDAPTTGHSRAQTGTPLGSRQQKRQR